MLKNLINFLFIVTGFAVHASNDSEIMQKYSQVVAPNKALATATSERQTVFSIEHSQSSLIASAMQALTACEAKRRSLELVAACEIRAINDTKITTGQAIRAGIPAHPHPIFLWKLQTSESTVFLAGSVHALKQTIFPLPRQYQEAFDQSDHVVVEVDTMNIPAKELQAKVTRYSLLPDSQLNILHTEELFQMIEFLSCEYVRYQLRIGE